MTFPADARALARLCTGSLQLDEILGGGIPANSINVVMGHPGTGKTVLAEQVSFLNATEERPALYFTTLSEPLAKIVTYLQRFSFFDESKLPGAVRYSDIGQDLIEHGVDSLLKHVREGIKEHSPGLIVIDSFKAVHDLVSDPGTARRLMAEVAGLLGAYEVTALLVGEYSEDQIPIFPEFAVADGIVQLARIPGSKRDERFVRVLKLRGSRYKEGLHAFQITAAGLDVFPRLVSPDLPEGHEVAVERVETGIEDLDTMLGGGLWRGSSTLVHGLPGTGKTTLALELVLRGVQRGEAGIFVNFQENPAQLGRAIAGLGMDREGLLARGLELLYASPVELHIDHLFVDVCRRVEERGVRWVAFDALGDLSRAAADPERFHDYLYAVLQYFAARGVTSVATLEGATAFTTDLGSDRLGSIPDVLIELGLEVGPRPRRLIRVVKARGIAHDLRPRTFDIGPGGITVLPPEVPDG